MSSEGEGTVPAPSHEAMIALAETLPFVLSNPERRDALTAAYAIDMPKVRAEERAATLREVIEWLEQTWLPQSVDASAIRSTLMERFNPEAES